MIEKLIGAGEFRFPYDDFSFPGQHSEEKILFVTRESPKMLYLRLLGVVLAVGVMFVSGWYAIKTVGVLIGLPSEVETRLMFYWLVLSVLGLGFGVWWFSTLWKKSVFIITNRRLTKIIYTTPWNKYHLSLNLDKIVDGGAYRKGILQPLLGLGYFVARSSAGNIKNFKIVNIDFAEDLHNYVTKLLYTFNNNKEKLDNFRPFIPYMKGEERRRFAPEYYDK